jgi:hypothetical protein
MVLSLWPNCNHRVYGSNYSPAAFDARSKSGLGYHALTCRRPHSLARWKQASDNLQSIPSSCSKPCITESTQRSSPHPYWPRISGYIAASATAPLQCAAASWKRRYAKTIFQWQRGIAKGNSGTESSNLQTNARDDDGSRNALLGLWLRLEDLWSKGVEKTRKSSVVILRGPCPFGPRKVCISPLLNVGS